MLSPYVETPPWSGSRNSDFSEFVTGLKQPTDIEITKRQWSAFYGTELDLQLRRRGIKTIFLCGISTNIGVESTAREAFQLGYDQVFVTDSMTAFSKEEHEGTLKFIFPRIGVLRTTDQAISMIGSKQS